MNPRLFQAPHPSSGNIFLLAYCWALVGGLLLQLLVLPAWPTLHAGHGLLKGGDWVGFHAHAVALALQMTHDGWGIWQLRPEGNAPIGLLAALYHTVGIFEPWVFLPINALLFGISAFMLHKIFGLISTTQYSFVAILPFIVFPSAAMIYGQIHKDIFSITGTLMVAFLWMDLAKRTAFKWSEILTRTAIILMGAALVWLVRPYLLQPLLAAGLLAALLLGVWGKRGRKSSWWSTLVIFLAIQLGSIVLSVSSPSSIITSPSSPSASALERAIFRINASRVGFATGYPNAGSNIDTEVRFTSIVDVLLYIPRALQIGLLAPFPSTWVDDAVSAGGGIMRVMAAIEMTLSYIFLLGWVGFFRSGKERWLTLAIAIAISLVLTLILTLVVTNIGTLYRMRYITWQLLNGLGILGWGLWLQARRLEKNN
jgi:hypothetical protein